MSASVSGVPERAYVPNSKDGSVNVIDARTYKVVAHFHTGVSPQHITPSWDLRWLYADDISANTLTQIDPRTGRPTGRVFPVTDPYNLYFTVDGSKAIVVAERFQRLDFYDPHTWRLLSGTSIPASGPDHLDFSADGSYLLISTEYAGYVFKVDVRTEKVIGKVRVGGLPVDVRLSPDGRVFYVANQGSGGVTVVDPVRMTPISFIRTGRGAHGLAVSRDAQSLYVSDRLAGAISVISFAKRAVVKTWHVGNSPDMLQVSPDGTKLWASNRFNGSVSVIDTRDGRVLRVIAVGASPHGLSLFPQPGRFSLGHNGVYR
jgi:YVTN family beta-propeller protein